ncbi:MAG: hypothetical protein JO159_03960 [Acidobacteria bacterium]|nr:hypothetical protein [Acidobacteriota bacterium]
MSVDKLPAIAFLTLCGLAAAQSAGNQTLPAGTMQPKALAACTSCHDEKIIVQQRLTKALWIREIDKMIKWGAILDPSDRDRLIEYFSENFPPDKPAYVASRSAASRHRSSKSTGIKARD